MSVLCVCQLCLVLSRGLLRFLPTSSRMPESVTNAFRRALIGGLFLPQVSHSIMYVLVYIQMYTQSNIHSNIVEPSTVRHNSYTHQGFTYQAANAMIKYIIMSNTPSSQCDLPSTIR